MRGHTYLLEEGPYTDLTYDEFAALLRPRRTTLSVSSNVDCQEVGAVTPIKWQGTCVCASLH
jgi:hypothetical protein